MQHTPIKRPDLKDIFEIDIEDYLILC